MVCGKQTPFNNRKFPQSKSKFPTMQFRSRIRLCSDILDTLPGFQHCNKALKRDDLTAQNVLNEPYSAKPKSVLHKVDSSLPDGLVLNSVKKTILPRISNEPCRQKFQDDWNLGRLNNKTKSDLPRSCRAEYNFHMGLTNSHEMQRMVKNSNLMVCDRLRSRQPSLIPFTNQICD